jgi:adenylate cyclase class IV
VIPCKKIYYPLFIAFAYLAALANEVQGGYNRPALENQQKYLVPAEVADALWLYIQNTYTPAALKKINPHYTALESQERFVDEYFDDAAYTLLRHQHGLRLRRVFSGKHVDLQLLQLKISRRPRQRNIRQEIKFNVNDRPDKHGGNPDHPFLRLIRDADRRQVDSALAALQVKSSDLRPVMEVQQLRRRLYLRERGNDLASISLDYVTAEAKETGFYELELAVDEQAYTQANAAGRKRLNHVIELLQLDLTGRFTTLQQNQAPKYNKMYQLLHQGRIRPRLYNLAWLGIGLVLAGVGGYLFRTRNQPAPETGGMF